MLDSRSEQTNTLEILGPINNNCEGHMRMDSSVERSENEEKASNLSDHDGIQFRPSRLNNGDESGVCSPPLWSKSPPRSPPGSKFSQNKFRNSPPSLRVQAIARGQKELMEMVKSMPESSYELSLKDLVDHQKVGFLEDDEIVVDQEKSGFITNKKQGSVKKQASVRKKASVRKQPSLKKVEKKIARTASNMSEGNNNPGLFLKMVFPMPFGGSTKKQVPKSPQGKAKTKENPYAKVSTKHVDDNLNDKSSKSGDQKLWWQRRYSLVSDDSESGGLSSNVSSGSSGSSGSNDSSISNKSTTRKKGGLLRGCSPFHLNRKKNISVSE